MWVPENQQATTLSQFEKFTKRQVITVSNTRPLLFSALPFERVLDMLIKLKFDESEKITANKKELVTCWNSLDWDNNC